MSSCLFTYSHNYIANLPPGEFETFVNKMLAEMAEIEAVKGWKKNRFYCDKWSGRKQSLQAAYYIKITKDYKACYSEQPSTKEAHDAVNKKDPE